MTDLEIGQLESNEIEAAADLCARAFIETPFSAMLIGGTSDRHVAKLARGMNMLLSSPAGESYVARDGGDLVGVMRMVTWPDCQQAAMPLLAVPLAAFSIGRAALRIYRFRKAWGERDPRRPHWHLDPLCVLPGRQGQGVGSALLETFCDRADEQGMAAYLETDQPRNVTLYERFGFLVEGRGHVLGLPNWFMWRAAR